MAEAIADQARKGTHWAAQCELEAPRMTGPITSLKMLTVEGTAAIIARDGAAIECPNAQPD